MKNIIAVALTILCMASLVSCQKAILPNEDSSRDEGLAKVTFNIKQFEQVPFNSAKATRAKDIKDLCSQVCLAVYFGNERVKDLKQKSTDANFGTFSLNLDEGTYLALIVAHNQSKNPTMTNPEKIQFDNDLSDVFYWSKEITIEDGSSQQIDVDMHRQVAMVRFVTTDNVPDNVASIKFYYTGGSAAIDARTGNGSVKSKQTAIRNITENMKGKPATFEIYTFPKDDSPLKIQVTGQDANGQIVFDRTFENVEIKRNQISVYTGELFADTQTSKGEGEAKFVLTTNDEWTTKETTF